MFSFAKQNPKKSKKLFDNALSSYYQQNYSNAFDLLNESIQNDTTNILALLLLSDVCIETKRPDLRILALERVILLDSLSRPAVYKFLGIENFNKGDYQNAIKNLDKYRKFNIKADSLDVQQWLDRSASCLEMISKSKDIQIEHIDTVINSAKNEYWPAISVDDSTLYFTRLIDDDRYNAFERIFYSKAENGHWSVSELLKLGGEGLSNEGTMCFSANGEWLFFTACGRPDGLGSCDIYYSRKRNGIWSKPKNAGSAINSSKWEAQPSISSDCSEIYFASNRSGGIGQKDIWCSKMRINSIGEPAFAVPINLGDSVNSAGNDYSPFIHADSKTLYFASDGRITLGASDLFISRSNYGKWSNAENLGYPINSRFDEDGLVVSPTANVAVFSSNREGAVACSKDLFQFNLPNEFLPIEMGYLDGFVYDESNNRKLNAVVECTELNTSDKQLIMADDEKGYTALIKAKSTYALNVSEPGFLFYSHHIEIPKSGVFNKATQFNIPLTPVKAGDVVVLNNIFFDFDSYQLKPESEIELQNLIRFLTLNSSLKVEIAGHTDNLGPEKYNLELSENRAKSICNYLRQKINAERITYKGYGSGRPIESNETEAGRMKNRRSELCIVAN